MFTIEAQAILILVFYNIRQDETRIQVSNQLALVAFGLFKFTSQCLQITNIDDI